MAEKTFRVLIADDSEDDRFFLKRALRDFPSLVTCGELQDGNETIAYLWGEKEFSDRKKYPFPDILILDLKMPRMNGYEVLQRMKMSSKKKPLIFVLSNSALKEDIEACFRLGVTVYFQKCFLASPKRALTWEIERCLEILRLRNPDKTPSNLPPSRPN